MFRAQEDRDGGSRLFEDLQSGTEGAVDAGRMGDQGDATATDQVVPVVEQAV
jgi:hypothetical protein